uniref:G-protein coupled receptors family 3 profile domain-containing protein n=1 Tax=Branchiostoma floridae TaxID=7739 RepID=C3XQ72_BRAFL|eukprot:XP_002614084.1 hypothetical protein BRAFLDRAFT_67330 [Branchiostoma floridae]
MPPFRLRTLLLSLFVVYMCGNATTLACEMENSTSEEGTGSLLNANIKWPVQRVVSIEGDLVLGGMFNIHERSDAYTCGKVLEQSGVQAMEAMLYTVDMVNNDHTILPNITIGVHILDSCDRDTVGLEQAVDFIRGSMNIVGGSRYKCEDGSVPTVDYKKIVGVVGCSSSVTSIQVANLLKLFTLPQISYWSTSPELSIKKRFPYFSRTVPSDEFQARAIMDIVTTFNWTYISVVYEDSNYGQQGLSQLKAEAERRGICIYLALKFPRDSQMASSECFNDIMKDLGSKDTVRVVIVYGTDQDAAELMRAAKRANTAGRYVWIGSDGWSSRQSPAQGQEDELEGAITIQPMAQEIDGFDEYFASLNPATHRRDPWLTELWEEHFQCKWPGSRLTPFNYHFDSINKTCDTNVSINVHTGYKQDGQLQFIVNAVLAFAHALDDVHRTYCKNVSGLCQEMKKVTGRELLEFIRNVSFTGITGQKFKFSAVGDGPPRYKILNYQQISDGVYEYVPVGSYSEGLDVNVSMIRFRLDNESYPDSFCSKDCGIGEMKSLQNEASCCWICIPCQKYHILVDEFTCEECEQGKIPDEFKRQCLNVSLHYLQHSSPWAIAPMTFSIFGIVSTTVILSIFIHNAETPVVKASGRELSYVLFAGIYCCFFMTFVLISKPSKFVCGLQQVGVGFCFSMCYTALLTKTNRIARIFNRAKRSAKRPSYISPKSQLLITLGLVGVQILISAILLFTAPPIAKPDFPSREQGQLVCSAVLDGSFMIGLAYPIALFILCTFYAFKTRKIPEAFNEAKFIGFTMYTICIIWLAFVPIYYTTASNIEVRTATICFTISMSAAVTLACIFLPKVHIIVLHPEKNVKLRRMTCARRQSFYSLQGTSETTATELALARRRSKMNMCPNCGAPIPLAVAKSLVDKAMKSKEKEERNAAAGGRNRRAVKFKMPIDGENAVASSSSRRNPLGTTVRKRGAFRSRRFTPPESSTVENKESIEDAAPPTVEIDIARTPEKSKEEAQVTSPEEGSEKQPLSVEIETETEPGKPEVPKSSPPHDSPLASSVHEEQEVSVCMELSTAGPSGSGSSTTTEEVIANHHPPVEPDSETEDDTQTNCVATNNTAPKDKDYRMALQEEIKFAPEEESGFPLEEKSDINCTPELSHIIQEATC